MNKKPFHFLSESYTSSSYIAKKYDSNYPFMLLAPVPGSYTNTKEKTEKNWLLFFCPVFYHIQMPINFSVGMFNGIKYIFRSKFFFRRTNKFVILSADFDALTMNEFSSIS